jgi:hypothetical protein
MVSKGLTSAKTSVIVSPEAAGVVVVPELSAVVCEVAEPPSEVATSGAVTPHAVMANTIVAHKSTDKNFFFILCIPPL